MHGATVLVPVAAYRVPKHTLPVLTSARLPVDEQAPASSPPKLEPLTVSGFTGVTAVKFGTVSATFTVVSDTEISALVPAAAVTGRVSVTAPGGTAISPSDFVITAAL